MKINSSIEYKELPNKVKKHLEFLEVSDIKWSLIVFVIGLYDIVLLLSLLSISKIEFFLIMIPFIVILHVWLIRLLFKNAYSTQLEAIVFTGVYGFIGAISFFVMLQSLSYYVLKISFITYYVVLNLIIIISSFILVRYQIMKYRDIKKRDIDEEAESLSQSKHLGLLAIFPALGYITGQVTSDTVMLKHYITLTSNIFITLFYVYIAAKFIHKYYFMKANMDYVVFQKPSKRERKELTKKGIVIK